MTFDEIMAVKINVDNGKYFRTMEMIRAEIRRSVSSEYLKKMDCDDNDEWLKSLVASFELLYKQSMNEAGRNA